MENTYHTRTKPKMNERFLIIGPHLNNQLFKMKYTYIHKTIEHKRVKKLSWYETLILKYIMIKTTLTNYI